MKFTTAALSSAALLQGAFAHTIFLSLNDNPVGHAIRVPSYDGPITDVSSNNIVCNGGPNPTTASPYILNVTAGETAKLTWRHTLTSKNTDVIDAGHKGPVMAYMKKVTDAKTDSGVGGGWFKIFEDGLAGGKWGVDKLLANKGDQIVTIPKCIAPGQYLLRGELIALHGAGTYPGAQFYMECAQINVIGGTGTKTPATVSLPGAYKGTDPGVKVNIYNPPITSYTIPGPSVFSC